MEDQLNVKFITGVEFKHLQSHADERGFFREVLRDSDQILAEGFGQWSHSLMHQGVIKAWHIHTNQIDWWYVPIGVVKAVLHDSREDSPTYGQINEFLLGDGYSAVVLKIPPGVAHGCKVVQGPAHLFYVTSLEYNPAEEGRIPFDTLGYDWLEGPEIK